MSRARTWWHSERGSATTELSLLAPLLIMLLLFVAVVVHRGVDARLRLDDAAHQAARAASIQRTPHTADLAAHTVATSALSQAGVVCEALSIHTTGTVAPGAMITVTVSCRVDLGAALLLGLTRKQLSATANEPVDTYRATPSADTSSR